MAKHSLKRAFSSPLTHRRECLLQNTHIENPKISKLFFPPNSTCTCMQIYSRGFLTTHVSMVVFAVSENRWAAMLARTAHRSTRSIHLFVFYHVRWLISVCLQVWHKINTSPLLVGSCTESWRKLRTGMSPHLLWVTTGLWTVCH